MVSEEEHRRTWALSHCLGESVEGIVRLGWHSGVSKVRSSSLLDFFLSGGAGSALSEESSSSLEEARLDNAGTSNVISAQSSISLLFSSVPSSFVL